MTKWTLLKISRDWKTRALAILFFIFFASFSIFYRQQNVTFPAVEMSEEYQDERQIYRLIPKNHFETELGQEVQKALGSNSVSLGMNRYILNRRQGNSVQGVDSLPDYIENGQQIVRNNLFLYGAKEFESYELLVETYLPDLKKIREEERFYNALEKSDLDIEWNPYSASQMIKVEFELLAGISLFFFLALLSADQFTKDQQKHWSVSQGLPIPWKRQWRLRTGILWGIFWLSFLSGAMMSYFFSLLFETSGSFNYPTAIYYNNQINYLPLWQYLLITILLVLALSYLLTTIITALSWILKNIYLTLLLSVSIFFLPQLWTFIQPLSSWQPSLYFNLIEVLDGQMALKTNMSGVVWWKAFLAFILSAMLIELIMSRVFSYIPSQTAGLQRRETK